MNELLWFGLLFANFFAILLVYRLFGKVGLFAWLPFSVIVANIQVLKTVEIFGLTATLGNIVYATSFLATDILGENYTKREAQKAVYLGLFALIFMTGFMSLSLVFDPSPEDSAHNHLHAIFGLVPRIAAASLLAYWISQMHDVWAYNFWKKRFPGKRRIWLRNNASTMISQLIDSIVFTLVAFTGSFETRVLVEIVVTTYLLKLIVAALDTPLVYLARMWRDRKVV